MIDGEKLARLRDIKRACESDLMRKPNVVAVGIGLRESSDCQTAVPAIVVSVTHKVPSAQLDPDDVIPSELMGVPVEVRAIGRPRAR